MQITRKLCMYIYIYISMGRPRPVTNFRIIGMMWEIRRLANNCEVFFKELREAFDMISILYETYLNYQSQ